MGIHPRVEGSVETMQKYQDMGVKHFCIGGARRRSHSHGPLLNHSYGIAMV